MAEQLTKMIVEGFNKGCIPSAVDGTYDDMLCDGSEEAGSVRKMKALSVKVETVTLVDKGR